MDEGGTFGVRKFRLRNTRIICSLSNVNATFTCIIVYLIVFSIYVKKQVSDHVRGGFKKGQIVMKVESRIIEKKGQSKIGGRSDNRRGNRRITNTKDWKISNTILILQNISYIHECMCIFRVINICVHSFFAYMNLSGITQWLKREDHVFPRHVGFRIIHPIARTDYLNLCSWSVKLQSKVQTLFLVVLQNLAPRPYCCRQ